MHIYDEFLTLVRNVAKSRISLSKRTQNMGLPEIYLYDQRYNILFVIAEIATRDKGYFVTSDLKSQTNLSLKSVERFTKVLVDFNFYHVMKGEDKRVKRYYPTKNLPRHIKETWVVRIKQIEAMQGMSRSKYNEALEFLKKDEYIW